MPKSKLEQEFEESLKRYVTFPQVKLPYITFRKLRSLMISQIGYAGWEQFFKYLTRDVNIEPTLHERVQVGTAQSLLQTWMHNYADNLTNIRYGDEAKMLIPDNYQQLSVADLVELTPILAGDPDFETTPPTEDVGEVKGIQVKHPPKGSAVVIGRGPSLFQHGQLQMLAEALKNGYKGKVICSDGGLIPTLEANIVPDAVVSVDGAPIIKKFFEHPRVKQVGNQIKWLTSVTIHHDVYLAGRNAGMPVYWFNPQFDDWRQIESWTRQQRLLSTTPNFPRGIPAMNSGGNAGACAWIAAMEVYKCSPVALLGIDFGYPEGTPLEQTQYYSSVLREAKGDTNLIRKAYKEFYHPVWKKKAYCDLVFYHYRQAFIEMQNDTALWYKLYGGTVNCTEGGTLFGPNITCMAFKDFLEKWKK